MAKVRNFTAYGIFVELEPGIDGLVHISDLSWTKKYKHPAEFTKIGEDLDVVVLDIDKEAHRLSLGHKQIEGNPWDVFESIFLPDSVHEGTVLEVFDKGAVIALPYGVEAFATPKNLVKEDGTTAKVDEKLPFKVTEFNKAAQKITVSHTRVFEDQKHSEEKPQRAGDKKQAGDPTKSAVRQLNASQERTTLGDITELAELKSKMEQDANRGETELEK